MKIYMLLLIVIAASCPFAALRGGYYASVTEEVLTTPASAAMAGSDLSVGSGTTSESTPANLPFDSLSRLFLTYSGYYGNVFSTSMLTWNGKIDEFTGVSLMSGYVYIPDIPDNRNSIVDENGNLLEERVSYYSASKLLFRAGVGRRFDLGEKVSLGAGLALNAGRERLPDLGYGISLDGGLRALFVRPGISVALQAENVTSSYIYWSHDFKERSYPHVRAGAAWEMVNPYFFCTLAYATPDLLANEGINSYSAEETDNDNVIETPEHYEIHERPSLLLRQGRYGIKFTVLRVAAFRLGYGNSSFSFGAGLRLFKERAGFDVAYVANKSLAGTYQLAAQYSW